MTSSGPTHDGAVSASTAAARWFPAEVAESCCADGDLRAAAKHRGRFGWGQLPGPRGARRHRAVRGSARSTSWSRIPPTRGTGSWPNSVHRAVVAGARWCCRRRWRARSRPPEPVPRGLLEPRLPVPPGLDLPRALAAGLVTVSALGLLPADLDALATELDREMERDHPSHEPFVNPAKSLALRAGRPHPAAVGAPTRWPGRFAGHAGVHPGPIRRRGGARCRGGRGRLRGRAAAHPRGVGAHTDVFHDPFDDPPPGGSAAPPRVMLLSTEDCDPTAATLRLAGRPGRKRTRCIRLEEVPSGTPQAVLRRAGTDRHAVRPGGPLPGAGQRGARADRAWDRDAHQLAGPA